MHATCIEAHTCIGKHTLYNKIVLHGSGVQLVGIVYFAIQGHLGMYTCSESIHVATHNGLVLCLMESMN